MATSKKIFKAYIAFSIHGTNKFIVAVKNKINIEKLPAGFNVAKSRRPDYNVTRDGIKLHWDGLLRKSDNTPYVSPSMILRRFKELETQGWIIVNRDEFVKTHFPNRTH